MAWVYPTIAYRYIQRKKASFAFYLPRRHLQTRAALRLFNFSFPSAEPTRRTPTSPTLPLCVTKLQLAEAAIDIQRNKLRVKCHKATKSSPSSPTVRRLPVSHLLFSACRFSPLERTSAEHIAKSCHILRLIKSRTRKV